MAVPAKALKQVRANRSRHVANSRPVPKWAEQAAWVLDSSIKVPGTKRTFGIDGIITLVPGVGDSIGVLASIALVVVGVGAGVSIPTVLRMLMNVAIEGVVGIVPFAGALFDMIYKANERNIALMHRDLADRSATRRSSIATLMLAVVTIVAGLIMTIVISVAAIAFFVWLIAREIGA